MYGFCGDDKECMGFAMTTNNARVCGDDKECMGFEVTTNNVWVLR
jgi:hypothetical protein